MENNLKRDSVRFPLLATVSLKLPKGSQIVALQLNNDIPSLEFEFSEGEKAKEERTLVVWYDGATNQGPRDAEGKLPEPELLPMPQEGPQIVKLGAFTTKDPAITWHVFEQLKLKES